MPRGTSSHKETKGTKQVVWYVNCICVIGIAIIYYFLADIQRLWLKNAKQRNDIFLVGGF